MGEQALSSKAGHPTFDTDRVTNDAVKQIRTPGAQRLAFTQWLGHILAMPDGVVKR
jgi:hypothetical protein